MIKKILSGLAALAVTGLAVTGVATSASADGVHQGTCTESDARHETVIDVAATTIKHPEVPAVTRTDHIAAVTHEETVADKRYSYNPQGPNDHGTPVWPTPVQGKWQANTSTYHSDDPLNTVFQASVGHNQSWFYWTTKVITVIDTPAKDVVVEVTPRTPAWIEPVPEQSHVVDHDAVLCQWYTWDTHDWTPGQDQPVNWDQTLVGPGQIAPTDCHTTYQQDLLQGTRAEIDAILDENTLTQGEDYGFVKSWVVLSTEDCVIPPPLAEVTPLPPTFTDVCGVDEDSSTLPDDTESYTYNRVTDGSTVTVTVTANEGYVFPEDARTDWVFEFTDEACPVVTPPVTEPPVVTPPVVTPPAVTPPVVAPPVQVAAPVQPTAAAAPAAKLAATGGEGAPLALLAGVLVAAGIALTVIIRRAQRA